MNPEKYYQKTGLKILKRFGFRGKRALKEFKILLNRITNYSEAGFPNIVGTSKLSPFIKFGQLHVETIWDECIKKKSKTIGT